MIKKQMIIHSILIIIFISALFSVLNGLISINITESVILFGIASGSNIMFISQQKIPIDLPFPIKIFLGKIEILGKITEVKKRDEYYELSGTTNEFNFENITTVRGVITLQKIRLYSWIIKKVLRK